MEVFIGRGTFGPSAPEAWMRVPLEAMLLRENPTGTAIACYYGGRIACFVRPIEGLAGFEAAATFTKHRHSALVNSGLDIWLTQQGIGRLIVSGIRTEQCCETTTRHASDLGWEVDYVTDATLTFDMVQPDGKPLSAADIKARTATVLAGRFATICGVAQALERAA